MFVLRDGFSISPKLKPQHVFVHILWEQMHTVIFLVGMPKNGIFLFCLHWNELSKTVFDLFALTVTLTLTVAQGAFF